MIKYRVGNNLLIAVVTLQISLKTKKTAFFRHLHLAMNVTVCFPCRLMTSNDAADSVTSCARWYLLEEHLLKDRPNSIHYEKPFKAPRVGAETIRDEYSDEAFFARTDAVDSVRLIATEGQRQRQTYAHPLSHPHTTHAHAKSRITVETGGNIIETIHLWRMTPGWWRLHALLQTPSSVTIS